MEGDTEGVKNLVRKIYFDPLNFHKQYNFLKIKNTHKITVEHSYYI